ncbi:iron-containing redox enzyme family protein [Pseudomonas fluorescens]|uniref:iron-containing redox enzyme family protein n=2 Tax=Pseudomonas TaxID=286 RepID=UPI00203623B2|nr:iron-containing redox enzyme family protein [Pseudomonas fluorescens]
MLAIHMDDGLLENALDVVRKHPLLGQPASFFMNDPYHRPTRPQDLKLDQLKKHLPKGQLSQPSYLAAQRLLMNRYEQDMVFLPIEKPLNFEHFNGFYNAELRKALELLRPLLEQHVFGWLDDEISLSGSWDLESFLAYTSGVLEKVRDAPSGLLSSIQNACDPKEAARYYLIQCAGDFLSEASAMGRNVLGNFGPFTSELFKIYLDEYGYGVHEKKHSTIFERLMTACDLDPSLHTYWQFYTASSISLINYFHYVSHDHAKFFRYLGAMYYTEASLAFVTRSQAQAIKAGFGDNIDTLYFDEHNHIDVHHGRMALDKLVIPMIKQYGVQIIPEILRGFEEFRLLQDVADEDLFRNIEWQDNLPKYVALAREQFSGMSQAHVDATFEEPQNEISVPHAHPVAELFSVQTGLIELVASPAKSILLKAGESIVIPKGMLHGTKVLSATSRYAVTGLE